MIRARAGRGWRIAAALLLLGAVARPAEAGPAEADLALVLAVDVSSSMNRSELALQRQGYVAALSDPEVAEAITLGGQGRVALAYVEWADPGAQAVVMPWTVIASAAEARAFAGELAQRPILQASGTSISAGLAFAAALFDAAPVHAPRQVIDISGDGFNNAGPPVEAARDAVVRRGIVINGLPVLLRPAAAGDSPESDLAAYYRDCVIGGPGAFVVPVTGREGIAAAIRRKLVLEIAGRAMPERSIAGARLPVVLAAAAKADCMAGQKMFFE